MGAKRRRIRSTRTVGDLSEMPAGFYTQAHDAYLWIHGVSAQIRRFRRKRRAKPE